MRLVLVTAVLFACAGSPAQAAVVCSPNQDGLGPVALGSVDGDDTADLSVGLPASNRVVVEQTRGGRVELTGRGRFGSAVAIGDVDDDGCADVVVGAPGIGKVSIFRGSPTGLQTTPLPILGAGRFGTSVAITQDSGLWVGAPGEEKVHRFTVTGEDITSAGVYTARTLINHERFGAHLAPGVRGVYVGVPRRSRSRGAVEFVPAAGPHKIFTLPTAAAATASAPPWPPPRAAGPPRPARPGAA